MHFFHRHRFLQQIDRMRPKRRYGRVKCRVACDNDAAESSLSRPNAEFPNHFEPTHVGQVQIGYYHINFGFIVELLDRHFCRPGKKTDVPLAH